MRIVVDPDTGRERRVASRQRGLRVGDHVLDDNGTPEGAVYRVERVNDCRALLRLVATTRTRAASAVDPKTGEVKHWRSSVDPRWASVSPNAIMPRVDIKQWP